MTKDVKVAMHTNDDGTFKAVVTTVVEENGVKSTSYETFQGDEAEVKAKVASLNITKTEDAVVN